MTRLHRIPSGDYGAVAMALHWLIALLLIAVVMLGLYMVGLPLKTDCCPDAL
jgi:cytochrome b561